MRCVVVHYHEIALKKGNRPHYISQLLKNIHRATVDLGIAKIRKVSGRVIMELELEGDWEKIRERLGMVFGIANFSLSERHTHSRDGSGDLEVLAKAAGRAVLDWHKAGNRFETFRVAARRSYKQFPHKSPEINQVVGGHIRELTGATVNLGQPDLTVHLEVIPRESFLYFEKHPGPGGLPIGVSGRVCVLLSGGIDSPVAAYRMLQRGCRASFVHFHGAPFLTKASSEKASDLAEILTRYQYQTKLYSVPFGEIQRQVTLCAPSPLRVVLYRRLMVRIAEVIGQQNQAQALVTGESLAQVASQTLTNIGVIQEAANLPILRPLIGMDKNEISAKAEKIGTYAISIQPDQDCCSLFVPKHPATHSKLEEIKAVEEKLHVNTLVAHGVEGATVEEFHFPEAIHPTQIKEPVSS